LAGLLVLAAQVLVAKRIFVESKKHTICMSFYFLPRDAICIARTMLSQLRKMSVCPSHAGILLERLNVRGAFSHGGWQLPVPPAWRAIIAPSQHVRVLGMIFSADLSLEKHVSNVSATASIPSASTTAHPALTDFGVCHDARARLRDVPRRLL